LQFWQDSSIVVGMPSETSLRERKKLAARTAMSHAAWSLMVDQGIDAVTPEAVAEAVGISPRTFRNYFSSREEAIVDGIVSRSTSIVEGLRARPADEPLWDSLQHVLPDALTAIVPEHGDMVVLMRLCRENPALLAQHLAAFEQLHQRLVETIAERTGTDAGADLAPHLLAAAIGAALQTSTALWAEWGCARTLPDLVRESLAQLRAGLPIGAAPPTT
jgi:AcrR family transcriptional regulator